ncbi:MAG: hypothetical protein VYD19_03185, partial [Myxococcota bacterium]|nr:hypothetical protein [Myxococcota bacterium]
VQRRNGGPMAAYELEVALPNVNRVDRCQLEPPLERRGAPGSPLSVGAWVSKTGVTDQSPGVDPGIVGEFGYGPEFSQPADNPAWQWIGALPREGWDDNREGRPGVDAYQSDLLFPRGAEAWSYAFRFSSDGGSTWTYCDRDSADGYQLFNAGYLITEGDDEEAQLLINEVDATSPDGGQFVEIFNAGAAPVELLDISVTSYDSEGGVVGEQRFDLLAEPTLAAGAYLLLMTPARPVAPPPGPPLVEIPEGFLSIGSGAVQLNGFGLEVLDALVYGPLAIPLGEGAPAPADGRIPEQSLGRCPNGVDSQDNLADFQLALPSPGAANLCP